MAVIERPHRQMTPANGIHGIAAWDVADDAARDALTPALTVADIGKVCQQPDQYYVLAFLEEIEGEGGPEMVATWLPLVQYPGDALPSAFSAAASQGISLEYARADHAHDATGKADWNSTPNPQSGTTLTLTDAMARQDTTLTHASGCVITVPGTLSIGAKFAIFVMPGAGAASFVGSAGLTVYPPSNMFGVSRTGVGIARLTVEILSATHACLSGDVA